MVISNDRFPKLKDFSRKCIQRLETQQLAQVCRPRRRLQVSVQPEPVLRLFDLFYPNGSRAYRIIEGPTQVPTELTFEAHSKRIEPKESLCTTGSFPSGHGRRKGGGEPCLWILILDSFCPI